MKNTFNFPLALRRYYILQIQKEQAKALDNWGQYNLLIDEEKKLVKNLNFANPCWREIPVK